MLAWITLFALAAASADRAPATVHTGIDQRRPDLAVAYRSHLTMQHPGIDLQLTWDVLRRDVTREPRRPRPPLRHRTHELYTGAVVTVDSHLTNHTLLSINGLFGSRATWTRGMMGAIALQVGLVRSFLNHPSWAVDEDGAARPIIGAGQFSGTVTLSTELGWDIQRRREHRIRRGVSSRKPRQFDLQWFIRPEAGVLLGWSGASFPVPVASINLGIRAHIGLFGGAA